MALSARRDLDTVSTIVRASSGITGLDEVLHEGYVAESAHLLSGRPGTGKTTLGWHFLTAGRAADGLSMFITLGEPAGVLKTNAARTGFNPEEVEFLDLSPSSDLFVDNKSQGLFTAAEVEREPTTDRILEAIERAAPGRVFVDSLTHLRYLARDNHEFRRHSLSFLRYVSSKGITTLVSSEATANAPDDNLRFLCDGVIELTSEPRRRSLLVTKFRGSGYRAGKHSLVLDEHGASVFLA